MRNLCDRKLLFTGSVISNSAAPWTAACQASLSFIISLSLLKLMSIESVMQSDHSSVVPCSSCLQSFQASGLFPISWLFTSGGQSIGASASASVPPMNIQDWFPSGLTGLISGTNHILRAPPSWSNYSPTALHPTNIILWIKSSKSELWEDTFSPDNIWLLLLLLLLHMDSS